MTYTITLRIKYKNDAVHNFSLPDGSEIVKLVQREFDRTAELDADKVDVELVSEEETR